MGDGADLAAPPNDPLGRAVSALAGQRQDAWPRVKELLHQAVALDPEPRARFLDEACASRATLRAELESLLSADAGLAADFLATGAHADAAGIEATARDAATASGLTEGQVFAHRYRLVRRLGEGGMGQVWLAEQCAPVRRPVALKLIKAGMYDDAVSQRFQSERQSLAIMDHPSIAKVFDAGTTPQGQPYFVMEYVPGLPITEYCDAHRLGIEDRLELFIQACEGVQHAHQKAVIHRDLKPANILVIEVDGKAVPRIIDFGLAKPATPRESGATLCTLYGQFMGTPGFMSPEQVDPTAQDVDTRTDVYSLGIVLYALLTGKLPFETTRRPRPPLDEWLRRLREEDPPAPSGKLAGDRDAALAAAAARGMSAAQLTGALRGDLDWITTKALERDRARRYGTPSELAADLRRHLSDEPVAARPASMAYRLGKFVRRRRLAASVVAMVAMLAILASVAAVIAVRKQHEAEFQAAQARHAQSRLLTQAAAQRLKDLDPAGARGIILEVLGNPEFARFQTAAAISVFQDQRAADAEIAVLVGHRGIVYTAAYAPDGARIVTAAADDTARIWDAQTGRPLATFPGAGGSVEFAAYSPDGTRIVTASMDKTARVLDARSGVELLVLRGHGGTVNSAAYSPDGTRIVTASDDKTAIVWDAHSGAKLAVLAGHGDRVTCAAFAPDGLQIATASDDKTAIVWDSRSGARLATLLGHDDRIASAAYSPDGARIVTASMDKTARVWNARTGEPLAVLSGHGGFVGSAAYSPDGTRIVTASMDKTARIWDARTGAVLGTLSGGGAYVISAAYSPDGARIVTTAFDDTARIWDARTGAELALLAGRGESLNGAAYSPDGTRVVTAGMEKTARIYDARTGLQTAALLGHDDAVQSAVYSPDGARIVTASMDHTARIWDAASGEQLAVLAGHGGVVFSAAYSPDGTGIVTASEDKTARIWDARTGAQRTVLAGHGGYVYRAAYSPDGRRIVTASIDKTARIWDARTGAQLQVLVGHGGIVCDAAFSPDGTRIVTASMDKTARLWDARSGAQLAVLAGHRERVSAAAFSPDGTRIVTASDDRTARIWDVASGRQLAALAGHGDRVRSVGYSPDGSRILTASMDKTVRIWDAGVPAPLSAQILWAAAAQSDRLPEVERNQLGLPADVQGRTRSGTATACDRAAAAVYDPDRAAPGVLIEDLTVDVAEQACGAETAEPGHAARADYQMGRALLAKGDVAAAKRRLELAFEKGYRTAAIDLGDLLSGASAAMRPWAHGAAAPRDPASAAWLYENAWRDGLAIAAFRLGQLDEHDAAARSGSNAAWNWYRRGADAGEPNALARFAERAEESAASTADRARRNALLLEAFSSYAAAVERARAQDWPDDAAKQWRYRRASLARLLAREGLMSAAADAYSAALAPPQLARRSNTAAMP